MSHFLAVRRAVRPPLLVVYFAILCIPANVTRAAPALSIDTTEVVVDVPIGTVSSNTLEIFNTGDSTLSWTLTDKFGGEVIKSFDNPWTSARSMRYDATRDCLWLSYYNGSELKKVSVSDGLVKATKNMGSNCTRPCAIEMDGSSMWVSDYQNTRFIKFNLDNMNVQGTVPYPSGWERACGLAIGDGKWYSTRYDYNSREHIYRLNPSSGAVQQTFKDVDYFYYTGNHVSHGDGGVWYGSYSAPKNQIKKFDPALGRVRRVIEMPDWYESTYIYDQDFTDVEGQLWVLTYRHDYHISGAYSRKIHLLDVGPLARLSQSADSGSIPAESSGNVGVVFDGVGAASGIHRTTIRLDSNGGFREKPYTFVVHAPGANGAPSADAGSDQTIDATAPTMPVTIDGSGSSDPNGDELVYTWTEVTSSGTVTWATTAGATIDLGPGVHDLKLKVDDLRGGVDTDTVRITLRAPDIEVDDCFVAHPTGGGTAVGTVTVRNLGDKTLNWSVSDAVSLDQSSIIKEFAISWVGSYSASAYPYTMTYDNSRDCLWVGYYYDNEIGKINASNGSTITTKSVPDGRRVSALDMEGSDIWTADHYEKKFRKYDPDTMSNTQTINNPWGTGYGPCSMARDSGQFYASQYYSYDICKLDPGSGAVQKTHTTEERQYYYNHHDAINGKVWYTRYNAPKTRIHCMDGTSGNLLRSVDMGHWDESVSIYDLSFVNSTQCWMLSYNVKGDAKRMAHLVDISSADKFSKSATGGSTAPVMRARRTRTGWRTGRRSSSGCGPISGTAATATTPGRSLTAIGFTKWAVSSGVSTRSRARTSGRSRSRAATPCLAPTRTGSTSARRGASPRSAAGCTATTSGTARSCGKPLISGPAATRTGRGNGYRRPCTVTWSSTAASV